MPCFVGSASELYLELAFRDAGLGPSDAFPVAHELGATSLALLCHPTLSDAEVERTASVVVEALQRATR